MFNKSDVILAFSDDEDIIRKLFMDMHLLDFKELQLELDKR